MVQSDLEKELLGLQELEIYSKLSKTIESCITPEHCRVVENMIHKLSKTNDSLSSALKYPLRIKINKLNEES